MRTINADPGETSLVERHDLIVGLLRGVGVSRSAQMVELRDATRREALARLDDAGKARFDKGLGVRRARVSAIIAREHGIPAVVATGRATTTLCEGQVVVVDGTTGRVEPG